ncbi:MAG TPA: ion transporter [Burkholderiaceae bacterium]|nr:ion transporter [Burkholderiaceae bacterium]HQR72695.1 ion transporter [Burkholderiaceae bacterium]
MGDVFGEVPVEAVKVGHHVSLGRWEPVIEVLVVLNLVALAFETLPDLSRFWHDTLWSFEVFCAAVYTIEYGVRLYLARPRWKYVASFYGIIDLLAILPFWLMSAFNLQAVRAFRLLRLLRLFKLVRYTNAVHRFRRAFAIARDDLVLFGVIALIVLYLSAIGIYSFEHDAQPDKFTSVFDSLWWAVATLTTVGYGDIYPITPGGRLFTFVVLVLGLGVIAVPSGLLASALSRVRAEEVAQHEAAAERAQERQWSD